MEFSEFLKSINSLEDNYPPVHLWNPDLCVGVEMRIDREGNWYYQNSIIGRDKIKILFSRILKFENGNFISISEGNTRLGSMVVSLSTGPSPITTTVIPSKTDSLFLKLTAERISSLNKGISVVSSNVQNSLKPETAKTLMSEIMEMVRNV